ncbi:adp-ribose pyrophosphatase : NTP pyrophosphohydrolase OS=Singulisphaera acidiphila (strain ATCC BAA-1392 / DSM 18658 / VKM B-2454 / MOB10) GN=Sinac_5018 PE=3 SV=1: NUDIX [Gemmata massiliana]|uniref:GDP-mannose pyrophosphatase n=1 Tax=Gemmata massiliana TaxID=1210884 RepID=A0A6P2CX02_9BACT|nr:NUDIX hydrolase [Gemmata massiliana]VTR92254.1 adp-ribose pyrophosphatase : NTP pyrophosphohydrolase OS=Singulisphaera acidiphila (strain ATCC BAA-1392 / DSM 18658 / VKM B-2454 / MOB10) GN=Sinac_5018 PE=3 SV=1: NUDIX [Gemmata massiliana]
MSVETVHVGRRIRVEVNTLTTADGKTIRRDAIRHPGAVVILPVLDAEHVVLLRNFRFVIGETLWEAPAGTVEPNEALEVCAKRELLEETGYQAAKWRSLGYMYASPGVMDEKLHLFVAEELTPGTARPEPDEQLEPVTVRLDEAIRMCLDGTIRDAKTITSLLLWERLRGERLA